MHKCLVILVVTLLLFASGCSKKPDERLQGKWGGQSVANADGSKFDGPQKAEAVAWAQGVRFEFAKGKMSVSIPSERARSGEYVVKETSGDRVTIRVARESGGYDSATLRFKGSKMYWDVGDGREVVMARVD